MEKASETACSRNQEASPGDAGADRETGMVNEMYRGIRFIGSRPCNQELSGQGVDGLAIGSQAGRI